jgi:5-methylcytosine-specific restriction endonuclease McrA
MKNCTLCQTQKDLSQFNKKSSNKDGLQNVCRECNAKRSKQYYAENREKHLKIIRKRSNKVIANNQKYIVEYLQNNPCVDCKEFDIIVLEFDHQRDKNKNISSLVSEGYSLDTVKKEIEKCEVVCANCHRRRTAKELNHYRHTLKFRGV